MKHATAPDRFRREIRRRTRDLGLSMSELARRSNLARSTVYRYLSGVSRAANTESLTAMLSALDRAESRQNRAESRHT